MRIGLFGGSFDPVHRGHVEGARAAREELALERVLFLPTAHPPHKPERRFAPAADRFAMVRLAVAEEPGLEVSDLEMLDRPVYTRETLDRFRRERPDDEPVLLVGSDSLAAFESWRDWREILASTEIGVLARPGSDRASLEAAASPALREALEGARIRWVETVAHPASSSGIRRRLAAGEPVPDGWLDPRVLSFAASHALYR